MTTHPRRLQLQTIVAKWCQDPISRTVHILHKFPWRLPSKSQYANQTAANSEFPSDNPAIVILQLVVIHQSQQRQRLVRLVGIWMRSMEQEPWEWTTTCGRFKWQSSEWCKIQGLPLSSTAILKTIKIFSKHSILRMLLLRKECLHKFDSNKPQSRQVYASLGAAPCTLRV